MKKIFGKENTRGFENKAHVVKIISSVAVICVFAVVGLCFFFRPSYSENEKRNLTEFPKFTFEAFFSGDYFSQISLWYSDTYPLRESMIDANAGIQSMYGDRDDQLIIPTGGNNVTIENGGAVENFGGIWIQNDTKTAYEIFYNRKSVNDRYIAAINDAADKLGRGVNVYNMVVPLHYTYKLTNEQIAQVGGSNCVDVMNYIYSGLDKNVTAVDIHPQLLAHKDEYIYFRTDHHWTARGAYYAYVAFCEEKGIKPTPLEDYTRLEFEDFLGTFYSQSGQNKTLKNNPDYVEAFVPSGTNLLTATTKDGKTAEYAIVYKGAGKYSSANKYMCFIGGDNPVSKIHNNNINDGSSIVVVKESYGNAFVPFLVDSYEYVYVIDYRYFDGSLIDFVEENDVEDVLFLNYISTTSTESKIGQIEDILG